MKFQNRPQNTHWTILSHIRQHKKTIFSRAKLLLAICVIYYAVTWFTGCPIKYTTGISCPGCGMTRAWLAVLRLDFHDAFAYHPLFWTLPPILLVFLLDEEFDTQRYRWIIILGGILYIGVYLIRIIRFPDSIVSFHPENGVIYRSLHTLLRRW